ncbi:MAG: hypothetical protein ABEJ64_02305 [Candidatus Nanohaloarchaea archaeon]
MRTVSEIGRVKDFLSGDPEAQAIEEKLREYGFRSKDTPYTENHDVVDGDYKNEVLPAILLSRELERKRIDARDHIYAEGL